MSQCARKQRLRARIQKVLSERFQLLFPNFDGFFFFSFFFKCCGGEKSQQNTTISGHLSARQRNAIQMAFPWRTVGGLTLNADLAALWFVRGSWPVLLRNPIYFVIFQAGPDPLPPPSGSAHGLRVETVNSQVCISTCQTNITKGIIYGISNSLAADRD